jgi:phage terminase large subunit-like protein
MLSCPPRVWSAPPKAGSLGHLAIELAAEAGLILDDWQAWQLHEAMGIRPDGRWSSFEVGLSVSRQNGKGGILEARELGGLFLPEVHESLLVHTAHEFKTAQEHFGRIYACIEQLPPRYRRLVKHVYEANGSESVEMRDGRRLRFLARSGGSGRGFSGDLVVLDEAMILLASAISSLVPTMSARALATVGGPQLWYTGSPGLGDDRSDVFAAVRDRGLEHAARLFWAEWGAGEPDDHTGANVDPDDVAEWYRANPAMHTGRMEEEFVEAERPALGDDFPRERLGVWGGGGVSSPIDADTWRALADANSRPGDHVAFALQVPPEGKRAAIARAGFRADGTVHGEVDVRPGTRWAVERLADVAKRRNAVVCIDASGMAGALIPDLIEAGVKVVAYSTRDVVRACGSFVDKVDEAELHHPGQPELAMAVDGARKRKVGEAWLWQRRDTSVDISPLQALTLAVYGLKEERPKKKTGRSLAV